MRRAYIVTGQCRSRPGFMSVRVEARSPGAALALGRHWPMWPQSVREA